MRKKFEMLIIVFFSFLFTVIFVPVNIKAASNIKVLAINGGDEETDTDYLYSESMFIDCLKKIKVNGQTISNENIHQFSNPTYTQLDRVINNTSLIVKVVVSKSCIFGGYISFLLDCWILLRAGMSCQ